MLCGQVGYKDAEDIALWERIIDTVVRIKVSTQSRNEGLFKLRSNYYATDFHYPECLARPEKSSGQSACHLLYCAEQNLSTVSMIRPSTAKNHVSIYG